MLERPTRWEDIYGQDDIVAYIKNKITKGTFPNFVIFVGDEGIGKTAIADLTAISLNYGLVGNDKVAESVIKNARSVDCIKRFNMAKDSGKDTAKEVLESLNSRLSSTGKMVVICDECHSMTDQAQDTFLVDTEYLDKDTYLIMCTTDKSKLKSTLLSRAQVIYFKPLTRNQMIRLLSDKCKVNLSDKEVMLGMIADWSGNKPRAALNLLSMFDAGDTVTANLLNSVMGNISIVDILPLLSCFNGNIIHGIDTISSMQIGNNFMSLLVEILKLRLGGASSQIIFKEQRQYAQVIQEIPEADLLKFVSEVSSLQNITREALIGAFIRSHYQYAELTTKKIQEEYKEISSNKIPERPSSAVQAAPTIGTLLSNSTRVR